MRALIVSETDAVESDVLRYLDHSGFTIDVTNDADEGVGWALRYPVDIALVVFRDKERRFLEAIRGFRAADLTFPVVAISTHARWEESMAVLEAGADEHLVKPVRFEEMIRKMRVLLERSGCLSLPDMVMKLAFGVVKINFRHQLVFVDQRPAPLTALEFKVLEQVFLRYGLSALEQHELVGADNALGEDASLSELARGVLHKLQHVPHLQSAQPVSVA